MSAIPRRRLPRTLGACALLGVLLLSACEPGSNLPPLPLDASAPYRLGVNEQIRIITLGEGQLSGQFRVNDRGDVAIPSIGSIHADGLTTSELEQAIAQTLRDKKLLLNPSVSVEVLTYRPVYILGEVSKPGQYPYQPNMTVLTAVAVAGGFTYRAQTGYASVLRNEDGHAVEGRVGRGTAVHPGDVINVFERYF